MINIRTFDSNLLKIDQRSFKNIGYITKNGEYQINSVNHLYLLVPEVDGFIEKKKEINT